MLLNFAPQKDEAAAAKAKGEDAQKAIAEVMAQAQSQMAKEAGAVRPRRLPIVVYAEVSSHRCSGRLPVCCQRYASTPCVICPKAWLLHLSCNLAWCMRALQGLCRRPAP